MLKIEKAVFNQLNFDFDAAVRKFSAEKEQHPLTVDVPAPSANYLVEAAYYAGGYEIVEREPEREKSVPQAYVPDPRKPQAMVRLEMLKGQKADLQLEEMRNLLMLVFELLPG